MYKKIDNCTVVLREANERTRNATLNILKHVFIEDCIYIVSENHLHKATKKGYEIAIHENRKWLFNVDADVLLYPEKIQEFIKFSDTLEDKYFWIYGMILDKISNRYRSAGHHLIRTKYLSQTLPFFEKIEDEIRPDTYIRKSMAKLGLHSYRTTILLGIHDFEQDYFGLYRKAIVHAVKNKHKVKKYIESWDSEWYLDNDYKIILAGFSEGYNSSLKVGISTDLFKNNYIKFIENKTIKDKPDFELKIEDVNSFINTVLNKERIRFFNRNYVNNKFIYEQTSEGQKSFTVIENLKRLRLKTIKTIAHFIKKNYMVD